MHMAEIGMLMAIVGTLMHKEIVSFEWIIAGLLLGSLIGDPRCPRGWRS
jgi:NAD(P) transhydrogenase subunit beta